MSLLIRINRLMDFVPYNDLPVILINPYLGRTIRDKTAVFKAEESKAYFKNYILLLNFKLRKNIWLTKRLIS